MSAGWIAIQRGIFNHSILGGHQLCPTAAFVWLVEKAAYKPYQRDIMGKLVTLKRGQLTISIRALMKAWKWKKGAVERWIKTLKNEDMIRTEAGTGQMVITICNYDKYQLGDAETGTADGTVSEQRAEAPPNQNGEGEGKHKARSSPPSQAAASHASAHEVEGKAPPDGEVATRPVPPPGDHLAETRTAEPEAKPPRSSPPPSADLFPDAPEQKREPFVYEKGIIKLTKTEYAQLEDDFPYIELRGALNGMADWIKDNARGPWQHVVKSSLSTRNQKAWERKQGEKEEKDKVAYAEEKIPAKVKNRDGTYSIEMLPRWAVDKNVECPHKGPIC
ncbi:MAG: hypothetical protein ROR55_19780 [Devosia sp.]